MTPSSLTLRPRSTVIPFLSVLIRVQGPLDFRHYFELPLGAVDDSSGTVSVGRAASSASIRSRNASNADRSFSARSGMASIRSSWRVQRRTADKARGNAGRAFRRV